MFGDYYHMNRNYKPKSIVLPPRKIKRAVSADIDSSVIISNQQATWIAQKIKESVKRSQRIQRAPEKSNCCYKFTLLYRHSRDGNINTLKDFRQRCASKGPTVTVGKVFNTEEILGGYNPISWSDYYSLDHSSFIQTSESFIFSLNRGKLDESIVSFVTDSDKAIWEYKDSFPHFGYGPDLIFGGYGKQKTRSKKLLYPIAIRSTTTTDQFELVDWEVFSIMKINNLV